MFLTIVIVCGVLFLILGFNGTKKKKANAAKFKSLGYEIDSKILTGKYVGGHPDINDSLPITVIFPKDNKLEIMIEPPMALPMKKGDIDFNFIKNILVEDQSSVEKRVTVGRLLTVGIFAFAWKKKKKNELAFLTIEWNDGRFDHETIFEFEGAGAMQNANTARNKVMKAVR